LPSAEVEVRPGEYSYLPIERVHFGPGCRVKLRSELDKMNSERPFVITGQTIATKTDLIAKTEQAAGRTLAVFSGIKQHAPESGIRQAINLAREARADSLISLGGGSPIDATKIVVKEISEDFRHSLLPHIAIPTTLSAAEFSHAAGMTDEKLNRKTGFRDVRMVPRSIFLDPEMTLSTPAWLWASTGVRSLDHAVEAVTSPRHQLYVDTLVLEAIRLLFQDLQASTHNPTNLSSRLACQIAAWMSDAGALSVGTGMSHSIGRVIGATWNIPHGITSCLTLAEVMRNEAKRQPERLIAIAKAEGKPTGGRPEDVAMSAANAVAELVQKLGLSKRLRDYGIEKCDFPRIAREAGSPEQVPEILKVLEKIW
jgi:alcohol dehydrogenase class IV